MKEEIRYITNEGKTAKNAWENGNGTLTFFGLYTGYIKNLGQFFFHTFPLTFLNTKIHQFC